MEEELIWDAEVIDIEWNMIDIVFSFLYDELDDGATKLYYLDFEQSPLPESENKRILKEAGYL